jgi:hypothetical protein
MTITNPVLYIDKDNIVKVVTVEMPINSFNPKYEKALQHAKDTAFPVENDIEVQCYITDHENIVDVSLKPDTFYTLKGKYELTFTTPNWIHPEKQFAALTEVKEEKKLKTSESECSDIG